MKTIQQCHTLFHRDDFHDLSGCLKEEGHHGEHICNTDQGLVAWDYDFDCDCDDCQTDSFNDMCIVYRHVNSLNP